MDRHADFLCVVYCCDVLDDYGCDAGFFGGIHDFAHEGEVVVVQEGVESDVGFDVGFFAGLGDFFQVFQGEIDG